VGNTLPEQLLKRKYDSREKVENLALVDTGVIGDFSRKSEADGDSWTSFVQISGGIAWAGTRAAAAAAAGQGGRRGNGSFQQIKNSTGAFKGEVEIRERDVKRANKADASAMRAIAAAVNGHLAQFGQMAEWMTMAAAVDMRLATGTIVDGVITLTSHAEHVTRIRQDMLIVASATPGTSGSLLGSGSIGYVQRVSRLSATPTVTVSPTSGGAADTPTGWPEGTTLYLFVHGTYAPANGGAGIDGGTDGDDSGFVWDTIESWNPASAPSATAFKTMDRTVEDLLGGGRLSAAQVANLNILQRIEKLAVLMRSRAGWDRNRMVLALVHTVRFHEATNLVRSEDMRQRGFRLKDEGKASTGYNYIEITCIGGEIRLEECPMYDPTICRMMDPDDWEIMSAGGFPEVVTEIDGLRWIRNPDNDTYRLQYSAYPGVRTRNPSTTAQCPLD
jgi:hypothetical protein